MGNGAVPRSEGAADLLAEVARLREECETLRQLAADRESLSRHTDEVIAIASHDIKTPLSSILGYSQYAAQLLSMPVPDLQKVEHTLAVIRRHGVKMTELLDDLIDTSRIQLAALEVRPARCGLDMILTDVLLLLAPDESERVDVSMPAGPAIGEWDQKRLEQVLANLIGNALKYSPEDSRVTVVVTCLEAGIEVAVSDRGMGIPQNDLVRVFDRFHRTAQARASDRPGVGLGLYISRGIVAAHGGTLCAESPGENLGATFRFTLPDRPPSERYSLA